LSGKRGSPSGGPKPPNRIGNKPRSISPDAEAQSHTAKRAGPQAYVEELVSDGFFKKQKTISEVKTELGNRGHHIALTASAVLCRNFARRRNFDARRSMAPVARRPSATRTGSHAS
jgi:hypothetical protein